MNTLLGRLKKAFPFATQRAATEDDFFGFCQRRDVEVVFDTRVNYGIYVVYAGEHFIFLNSRLSGWMLRYVMFHELGHFLFHVPGRARQSVTLGWTCGRNHAEAEATAAYMLLTVADLEQALLDGEVKRSERLAGLIALRLDLYREYGE